MAKNVSKLSEEERITVCRKLFIGGFFLLPWLWVINYIIFRQHLKDPACSPVIKRYINYSLTGAVLLTLPFFVWFILFQTQWQTWGTFGEKIAIVIPRGH